MTDISVLERLNIELATLLREDPRRVLLGEDVRDGGMLGLSRASVHDEALTDRVLGAPITPLAALGHAGGLAHAGRRPIVALPSAAALLDAIAPLRELTRDVDSFGDASSCDVLLLGPSGHGFGLGGDHALALESMLAMTGARVLALAEPSEAVALLRAAADFDAHSGPAILLLPRSLLLAALDRDAFYESLPRELHAARRVRGGDGARATVFCWGDSVAPSVAAAARSEHDIAVIDVASLAPLDRAALVDAARQTGKLVIAHSGAARLGVASELAALFADEAILHLDAPIVRVSGLEGLPYPDEAGACPSVQAIADAIDRVVNY